MRKKRLAACLLAIGLMFAVETYARPIPTAYAETKVIEADGAYIMGDSSTETLSSAQAHAKEDAMRRASEIAGIYIESYSKTVNAVLTEDEIRTLASKVLDVQAVSYRNDDMAGRGFTIHCHIRATVDTVQVDDFIRQEQAHQSSSEKEEHDNDTLAAQLAALQKEQAQLQQKLRGQTASTPAIELLEKQVSQLDLTPEGHENPANPDGPICQLLAQSPGNRIAIAALAQFCSTIPAKDIPEDVRSLVQKLWESYPAEPLTWYGMYHCTGDEAMLQSATKFIQSSYTEAEFYHAITYCYLDGNKPTHFHKVADIKGIYADALTNCMGDAFGMIGHTLTYSDGLELTILLPYYCENQKDDPFTTYYAEETTPEVIRKQFEQLN